MLLRKKVHACSQLNPKLAHFAALPDTNRESGHWEPVQTAIVLSCNRDRRNEEFQRNTHENMAGLEIEPRTLASLVRCSTAGL